MPSNGTGLDAEKREPTDAEKLGAVRKRYLSIVEACETLVRSGAAKDKRIQYLEAQLANCQTALDLQKQIARDSITQDNDVKHENAAEIGRLRSQVEALGGHLD